jgi:hypothetical protein
MHFEVDEQKSFYRYCTAAPPDYGEIFVGSNVQTVKTTKNNRKIFYYDSLFTAAEHFLLHEARDDDANISPTLYPHLRRLEITYINRSSATNPIAVIDHRNLPERFRIKLEFFYVGTLILSSEDFVLLFFATKRLLANDWHYSAGMHSTSCFLISVRIPFNLITSELLKSKVYKPISAYSRNFCE